MSTSIPSTDLDPAGQDAGLVALSTPQTIEGGSTEVLPPSTHKKRHGVGWRTRLEITLLSGPAIIVFVAFVIVPVIVALYYSFYSWKGFGPVVSLAHWWDNYKWTLSNPTFWSSVEHNGVIIVLSLIMQGPLAILMALLLNKKMRGRSIIRILIFVPWVVSEAIAGIGLSLMLQTSGAVNGVLAHLGIGKIAWLSNPKTAIWTLMFILTWKYIGFAVILMLAGLQGIPEELSEAAAVDGASYWKTQWHIMLPLLTPTIKIWAFLSIIGSMQLFDIIYVIWGQYIGNIAGVSTMVYFMAGNGRLSGQLGRGSAIAIVVFVISLIVALIYQRLVLNRNTEGALTDGGAE